MYQKILAVIAIFFLSPAAFGGASFFGPTDQQDVSVTEELDQTGVPTGRVIVAGTMSSVRFTPDDIQQIGCRLRAVASDSFTDLSALCQATDITGTTYSCFSRDLAMIDVIKAISPYSFVRFIMPLVLSEDGTPSIRLCEDLLVATRSPHIPDSAAEKSKLK